MSLIKFNPRVGEISETCLALREGLSIETWRSIGADLSRVENARMWWIGDWWNYPAEYGERRAIVEASEDLPAFDTCMAAGWVASKIETCRRLQAVSWSIHHEVASLEPAEQDVLLAEAERDKLTVRDVRARVRALQGPAKIAQLPPDTYRVLYADPPWRYNDELIVGYGAAEHHYPTLSLEELLGLKDSCGRFVGDLARPDSVLFLWATSPLIDDALQITTAWGFEYKTSFVWDKVKHNYGHYNSVRHELLLVCTRGSCVPDNTTLFDSVQVIERSEKHSEKPEEFRQIIDTLYTPSTESIDRIELFRRGTAPAGWHVWGNEANDAILQKTA